jgi:hypothetical protein
MQRDRGSAVRIPLADIPDANPRAFRDWRGEVHLIATHFVARAMRGPSLLPASDK